MREIIYTLLFITISISTGKCIDTTKETVEMVPPNNACGPHEKRIRCLVPCHFDDCLSLYVQRDCAAPPDPDDRPCVSGCVCESGYLRWNGVCIPQKQCPPLECINDPHAVRGCNERCGRTCRDYNIQKICKLSCRIGCDCAKGYVYDENIKKCVLPTNCSLQCAENEFYNPNGTSCPQPSCDCPNPDTCNDIQAQPGCFCKDGFIRNSKNKCIPVEDCKVLPCGENEYYDPNGTSCPQASCDFPNPETCNDVQPQPGCFCKDGFIRNPKNKCVPVEDCKEFYCCPGNQTYVPCTFRCPQNICPIDNWPTACKPPRNCPGGCGCPSDYKWDENDECIHASDCPP